MLAKERGKMKIEDIEPLSMKEKLSALEAEITKYHSRKIKTWRQWCYFDMPKNIDVKRRKTNGILH